MQTTSHPHRADRRGLSLALRRLRRQRRRPATPARRPPTPAIPVTVGERHARQATRADRLVVAERHRELFAIGAGPQVVAVDDQSNYPPEAPQTDLSGFKPNAEAIAGERPGPGGHLQRHRTKSLSSSTALKIPVYLAAAPATLDDIYQQITELGTLTGHRDEAADLVAADEGRDRQARRGRAEAVEEAHLLLRARPERSTR